MNIAKFLTAEQLGHVPALLAKALDAASCGICIADATQLDLPFIYVNRTFERMTGYSSDEVLGKNGRFLQGAERDQSDLAEVRRALSEHRETRVILRNYRKDGTPFWNDMRLAPVFDEGGRLTYYIGTQTDVTSQIESHTEAQRQALHFYQCLEAIPLGVLVIDRQRRIFFANKAASAITGKVFEPGAPVGNLADICQVTVADSGRPYQLEAMPIMQALAGTAAEADNLVIRRNDGQTIPIHVRAAPINDSQGVVTHAIAVFTDISEIREKETRLQDEEARHRAILNSSVDAIIAIDGVGIIQSVNPATEQMFGYSRSELLGQNVTLLMPEPHRSQHCGYLARYLETGERRMIGTHRETEGVKKDGTVFPVDLGVSEVKLAQGILFKGIIRDISERKKAEAEVSRTLAELKKSQDDLVSLLNQFRVGSVILGADQRVEFISESCSRFAGIDRDTACGLPWDQVLPFGPREQFLLRKTLSRACPERQRLTLHWIGADRTTWWVECDVRDDPRDQARRILLLYDITEIHRLRQAIEESRYGQMVGRSEAMRQLFKLIGDVAKGEWTVLIEGETGVGKELVAHSIHAASRRREGPFVAVNAAGLSESLLASQLFGHRKGAFTGAVADQAGFFESADGGTIFLDEIGDMPMAMQASLLRVLQEREVTRLGETRPRKVDVRILTATHKDLASEVRAGRFREDLLYRLRVARVYIPALRERKGDIPLLSEMFLKQTCRISGKAQPRFSERAMACMIDYPWPGNVRELKACVDYAVIHCQGDRIQPEDLPPEFRRTPAVPAAAMESEVTAIPKDARADILAALEKTGGNRLHAAKLLGISRATLYRRLAELNMLPPEK